MTTTRSQAELRNARLALFESFPRQPNPTNLLQFQQQILREIVATEHEQRIEKTRIRKEHIYAVRIYGDALAHTLLSKYAIRQLFRNPGMINPPALVGQGSSLQLVVDAAKALSEGGHYPIISDLTNIIRNGDVILCDDRNLPCIIECKAGKTDLRCEGQRRTSRQLTRYESILDFLRSGQGQIAGEARDRTTIEVDHSAKHTYQTINSLACTAIDRQTLETTGNSDEFFFASPSSIELSGNCAEVESAIRRLQNDSGRQIAFGTSLRTLDSGPSEIVPPVLWDIDSKVRWALMEGDVVITHGLRLDVFVGLSRGSAKVVSLVKRSEDVPWGYQTLVDDRLIIAPGNFALNVIDSHETIDSAGELLLKVAVELAGNAGS